MTSLPQSVDLITKSQIPDLLENAHFTRAEIDIATSGLCGVFALCLFDALNVIMPMKIVMIREASSNPKENLWRHVMIFENSLYFDMTGETPLKESICNYCSIIDECMENHLIWVTRNILLQEIKKVPGAYNKKYHKLWSAKIGGALSKMTEARNASTTRSNTRRQNA